MARHKIIMELYTHEKMFARPKITAPALKNPNIHKQVTWLNLKYANQSKLNLTWHICKSNEDQGYAVQYFLADVPTA